MPRLGNQTASGINKPNRESPKIIVTARAKPDLFRAMKGNTTMLMIVKAIVEAIKTPANIQFCRSRIRAGDQVPRPPKKTMENASAANAVTVKLEFIRSLVLFPESGRYRMSPQFTPTIERKPSRAIIEIVAEASPTS